MPSVYRISHYSVNRKFCGSRLSEFRNHIAHSDWWPGARPGSIRPRYVRARDGKAKFSVQHNEPDYTLDELVDVADRLVQLYEVFELFLRTNGLLGVQHADEDLG